MDRRQRLAIIAAQQPAPPVPVTESGPAPEKWAYAPGVTPEDIQGAEAWLREHASSSPIHLVAAWQMVDRLHPGVDAEERRRFWNEALAAGKKIAHEIP